jgi:hypothetical protein
MSSYNPTDATTQKAKDIVVLTFLSLFMFITTACIVMYTKSYKSPHPKGSEQSIRNDKY